jgi:hypothetical protein
MSAKILVSSWANIADKYNEMSDSITDELFGFYATVSVFVDNKEEVKSYILCGLSDEEQELMNLAKDLIYKHNLLPSEKELRERSLIVRKKLSRLYSQLGNLVYGERFRDYLKNIKGISPKKADVSSLF